MTYRARLMREKAVGELGRLGLLMAGAGAGVRGLKGLMNLGNRNNKKRKPPLRRQLQISVPVGKRASITQDITDKVTGWVGDAAGAVAEPFGQAMRGEGITNTTSWPPFIPLATLGGGAAMYGGYKLTDKLLDSRRKADMDQRLQKARSGYEDALRGRSKVSEDLDKLYDLQLEKQGTEWLSPDNAGRITGGLLTAGALAGIGSGMLTYNLSKKKRPSEVLRIAKQRRARERARRSPSPIYAQPSYAGAPDEDEMAGEVLDKVATEETT